jgi:hypothetical protein
MKLFGAGRGAAGPVGWALRTGSAVALASGQPPRERAGCRPSRAARPCRTAAERVRGEVAGPAGPYEPARRAGSPEARTDRPPESEDPCATDRSSRPAACRAHGPSGGPDRKPDERTGVRATLASTGEPPGVTRRKPESVAVPDDGATGRPATARVRSPGAMGVDRPGCPGGPYAPTDRAGPVAGSRSRPGHAGPAGAGRRGRTAPEGATRPAGGTAPRGARRLPRCRGPGTRRWRGG